MINLEFHGKLLRNVNRGDALYKFVERLKEKDGDEDEVLEVYYPSDEHNKLVKTLLGDDFSLL